MSLLELKNISKSYKSKIGNFQVINKFWAYLNELSAEFLEEGRFVTFPGYEWSGNTAVGGDRNV